jgi:phosphoenolpyruvate-protein kinase (PTS system EI component)
MEVQDPKESSTTRSDGSETLLKARPMSRGVAIGRVVCLHGNTRQFFRIDIPDSAVEREARRARDAIRLARRQLNRLRRDAGTVSMLGHI